MATDVSVLTAKERKREQTRRAVARYREKHPDRAKRSVEKWRSEHQEWVSEYGKKRRQRYLPVTHIAVIKYRARRQGLEFDLTPEWFESLFAKGSALSGIAFRNGLNRGNNGFAASVDRIDHTRGYTKDNCRLILQAENMFKGRLSDEEILEIAAAMLEKACE